MIFPSAQAVKLPLFLQIFRYASTTFSSETTSFIRCLNCFPCLLCSYKLQSFSCKLYRYIFFSDLFTVSFVIVTTAFQRVFSSSYPKLWNHCWLLHTHIEYSENDLCLSLHRLLSRFHRYCGTTLTALNHLIRIAPLSSEHQYRNVNFTDRTAFHVPLFLALVQLRSIL